MTMENWAQRTLSMWEEVHNIFSDAYSNSFFMLSTGTHIYLLYLNLCNCAVFIDYIPIHYLQVVTMMGVDNLSAEMVQLQYREVKK